MLRVIVVDYGDDNECVKKQLINLVCYLSGGLFLNPSMGQQVA